MYTDGQEKQSGLRDWRVQDHYRTAGWHYTHGGECGGAQGRLLYFS